MENLENLESSQQSQGEDIEMFTNEDRIFESNDENSGYLSEDIKKRIQERIFKVIVPKEVTRIPPLVGKLKASKWNSLFSVYLPMVFTEVMWGNVVKDHTGKLFDLLLNFGALVQCTNIVGAKSVEKNHSTKFAEYYNT
ncbi:hypothetical protein O181_106407 [Austropuccinia psidii MF-1]|uniref:Uncharacterized protein n=1 Tax=Austropuccinia psidii MF-1 TaxID=1389203 RepID=A0A9Q3PNC2_9BASI|nr:hypothetical protein [Austropuccinia psidii MF-1]